MSPFFHALNIGTLAAWLALAGASTVACVVKVAERLPTLKSDTRLDLSFGEIIDLDAEPAQPAAGSAAPDNPAAPPTPEPAQPVEEVVPLPDLAQVEPLPELPDLPEPKPQDLQSDQPKPPPRAAKPSDQPKPPNSRSGPTGVTANRGGSNGQSGTSNGQGNGPATGNGSAAEGAARLSKGRVPSPVYPEECRRNNQEGRVVIRFTIDESGNVVDASVASSSSYAAMDQSALNAIRRAKFPPGAGRATATRGVAFKLH